MKVKYLIHFEMLMMKGSDGRHALMEHQKSTATEEEWVVLNEFTKVIYF
jgi:hypothetical protein